MYKIDFNLVCKHPFTYEYNAPVTTDIQKQIFQEARANTNKNILLLFFNLTSSLSTFFPSVVFLGLLA